MSRSSSAKDLPQPEAVAVAEPEPHPHPHPQIHILNPESLKLESHIRWLAADSAELSFALSAGMGQEGLVQGFIHRLLPTIYKRCNCRCLLQQLFLLSVAAQVDSCCKSKKCAWETATATVGELA